jgi:hypothetical protein
MTTQAGYALSQTREASAVSRDSRNRRVLSVICSVLAVAAYHWTYIEFLNVYWEHAGFAYDSPDPQGIAIAYILAILPSLWMPLRIERPSQYLYWLIYLTVYIPTELTAALWRQYVTSQALTVMLFLTCGMLLVRLSYAIPPGRIRRPSVRAPVYWTALSAMVVLAIILVLTVYAGNIQFVSLYESNELRSAAREIDADAPVYVNYSLAWLGYTLFPLIASYGLYRGKKGIAALGLIGSASLYTTAGLRIFLFAPVLLMTASLLFRKAWSWIAVWAPLGAALAMTISTLASLTGSLSGVLLGTLVSMRTFGNNGLLTNVYAEFFAVHPLTYLSHLRGFNLFIPFPYSNSLGFVVGEHFFGFEEINANANMWATDGLAAFGPPGLLFVGLVVSCVFWLLDTVTSGLPPRFAALSLSAQGLGISNLSLFSILLGGGLGMMMLLLYLFPAQCVSPQTSPEQGSG